MYFSKDEVIELNDKRKFLVVDTALIDDSAYFKIIKLDEEEKPTEETEYISVQNDNGKLYQRVRRALFRTQNCSNLPQDSSADYYRKIRVHKHRHKKS